MNYIIIDVFVLFFIVLGFFVLPSALERCIFIGALLLLWIIWPHISYLFARKGAIKKIKDACDRNNAEFSIDGDIITVKKDGKTYVANIIPTRYRAQMLHIENNGKYYRNYYFSFSGKVKVNLPFAIKSKPKALPQKVDGAVNCLLFIKEPLQLMFTRTNAPLPVYSGDDVMGFTAYEPKAFLNVITGEYK